MMGMKYGWLTFIPAWLIANLLLPAGAAAQLTAPGAVHSEGTAYPVFSDQDSIYIFCTDGERAAAALEGETSLSGSKTWQWDLYDPGTGSFSLFRSETNSDSRSVITGLADGCYRLTILTSDSTLEYRAWVFNDWNKVTAAVTHSFCDYFQLEGTVEPARLTYHDLQTGQPVELFKNLQVRWLDGEVVISALAAPRVFSPPPRNTLYAFEAADRFGCKTRAEVNYVSIVPEAIFTADPMKGEAPLDVAFKNDSENGDSGEFEWLLFRDLDDIKREAEITTLPIDSIMERFINDQLAYTYENSGTYMVKLVARKTGDHFSPDTLYSGICVDTVYLEDYIIADTSYFAVPNVFTPNSDGTNDNFVVKFWSMKEVKISVFNRWGRLVHFWESGDVRGFEGTWLETAWDGTIGGRLASPGVYYYVVEGRGRDGVKRWKHGDVYLIRGKED